MGCLGWIFYFPQDKQQARWVIYLNLLSASVSGRLGLDLFTDLDAVAG